MPRHISLKLTQPDCIYCAGEKPTVTVDHMPPRILFEDKQRPKGLEFGSCKDCQNSTRREELAIAMFSRIFPDAATSKGRNETRRITRETNRRFPGLFEEMRVDQLTILNELGQDAKQLPTWNFVSCGGPIASGIIDAFAKKLALALHFELTKMIVPRGAGLYFAHFTNYTAIIDGMPGELMNSLGKEKLLEMGRQSSEDVFTYHSQQFEDELTTIHMAYFRQSFALLMVVYPDFADIPLELVDDISVH